MKRLLCFLALMTSAAVAAESTNTTTASIHWLGDTPAPVESGVSFGVPWVRGAIQKSQTFTLKGGTTALPVQTWPLAYWPDGSVKWTGVATVAGADLKGELTLTPGAAASETSGQRITVRHSDTTIAIDTGNLQARIATGGERFLESLSVNGREIARAGRLVCLLQEGPDSETRAAPPREEFRTRVDRVTLEQSGPIRAVVKIEGMHVGLRSDRAWLPFVVRLYFYAGQRTIRMVHTIFYDGDEQRDFIRGLGIVFDVPMREEIQNRDVRFAGDGGGVWAEPIQPMIGRGGRFVADPKTGDDVYPRQLTGERVPNRNQYNARGQGLLADWAVWDDFKLVQPNCDGFTLQKGTNAQSTWLHVNGGHRAGGLAFVGDVSGGLAVGLKNFWQSYPSALEVRHASAGAAELRVWLWSPDAPAMDMRHYDVRAHGLDAVYEDVQPGFSTPNGVARTSELTLFATDAVPSNDTLAKFAQVSAAPPVLVCTPQYLHAAQAFGVWGLEDHSTPVKDAIERRLAATLNFYLTQPEQQRWYGFWDFGDVMHSYDPDRHEWRYDLGGMAWDNSELGTDMWLWYSFLRTGRADVFRMAEAMTRHTGEVDCYHLGRFAGLGSRHNVRHWGCGAKEARISQAAYRRFYYYLTTDERVGDVMREMLNADYKTVEFDPMREAQPITEAEKKIAPTRVRLGPDWLAFVSNWMTEWERTGDTKWRDKILAGAHSLAAMPLGLRSGKNLVFGYDPASGKLYQLNDQAGVYNLATIMGGAEVIFELNQMLDDPVWKRAWLQYCRLYNAPADVLRRDMQTGSEGANGAYARDGRLAAYVYSQTGNAAFLDRSIAALLRTGREDAAQRLRHVDGAAVLHPIDEGLGGTNGAAQNGLETITMLGFVGDKLPKEFPPARPEDEQPRRQRRGPPRATPPGR